MFRLSLSSLGNLTVAKKASSLEDAVYMAFKSAKSGDAVLLSPACSSFDMFENYAQRGDLFKITAQEIADGMPLH
ncbi:hypothetical protein GMMP15_1240024 [Candidatus Magnetomoraceae bacterium gMMP-15]